MPDLTIEEVTFLALGCGGFTAFGCCLVYLICDAETFVPVWLERAVLLALNAKDKALIALADALLAASLYLNAPKGSTR